MNLLFRSRLWVTVSLVAGLGISSPGYGSEPSEEYLLGLQQLVTRGETGVGLFPIQVPGETFAAERSQIGHRVADFTLSGNGIAGFELVRKFKESPSVEPYAFGNMSIEIPTLTFRALMTDRRSKSAFDMSCTHLSAKGIQDLDWSENPDVAAQELFNDVKFTTGSGGASLLPRVLVNPSVLSNYPVNALLVSARP